jgi:peptide/nickel transport system substrate-binding protein
VSTARGTRCIHLLPAALLVLAGCGDPGVDGARSAADRDRPAATEPRYGGNVILGAPGQPVMFNPLYSQDSASSDVEELVFAGLMRSNERLELVPHVAIDHPEVSDDGTGWTFRLREGVLFHDGVELTAHDVVFTFSVLMHPDYTGPRGGYFRTLESVEALSDYEVHFRFSEPDARFLSVSGFGILPRHLLEHVPVAELGDYRAFNIQNPVGAGPFRFVSWTRGQNLVLEAFDDYFEGRPYLDRVTFRYVSDQSAAVLQLETGGIDHMIVPTTEIATVRQMPHVELHNTLALRYDYIGWNLRNPLFEDRRVRRALTHAIDRQEIVETLMEGYAEVTHAPVSPLMSWAYNDDVARFPYDPDRARALLAEAGWTPGPDGILRKDGRRFSFQILSNDGNVIRRDIGVIAQQYLRAVGIEVRPAQMEWGAFLERIQPPNNDFDAIVLSWSMGLDPDPSPIWHSREIAQGLNNIGFSHPRVDELSDLNVRIVDPQQRAPMLAEVWRILAEEQPYTFLFYPHQFIGLNRDVRGFIHHPRVDNYRVNEWWLDR